VISVTEISNKFQKIRFGKEKSVEGGFTLGPTAQATLVLYGKWVFNHLVLYIEFNE
jgi:hypothetical protein